VEKGDTGSSMGNADGFNFGTETVAKSYDDVLVPLMFVPWAHALIGEHGEWQGRTALDLATGTGVVAQLLSDQVGPGGHVIGTDLNPEMLAVARQRCAETAPAVQFIESPAHPLRVASESIDIAVCQQGFQFFPDRLAAAREILRVLRPGGLVLLSTWLPVTECVFFGWICQALTEIDEPEIAAMMRVPFDHVPPAELSSVFNEAEFADVRVERQSAALRMPGGVSEVLRTAYATPIGGKLAGLPEPKRERFHSAMGQRAEAHSPDGVTMGELATHVLRASKPAAAG
jgi:ubiquinone/menaquinone biosynthesis C-methylase UbiE